MATQSLQGPPGTDTANGNGLPHMPPPPLPPLNTGSAPGASQPEYEPGSPTSTTEMSAGGTVRRQAPEPNKRALYVGGLDTRVAEDVLKQIFETSGHVQNVKIIPDKNVSQPQKHAPGDVCASLRHRFSIIPGLGIGLNIYPDQVTNKGFNYGFVEFDDPSSAQRALDTLNGRRIHGSVSRASSL